MSSAIVLLASYNGGVFLTEQVESILRQQGVCLELVISEDGESLPDLKTSQYRFFKGPSQGYVRNFLSMLCNPSLQAPYYALSDQDDVWLPEKLKVAISMLDRYPEDIPVLYCGRTTLVDAQLTPFGESPLFRRKPSFRNALTQNIAGGNTMVLNQRARELVMLAGEHISVPVHDWWIYLVVTACGGKVIYDRNSYVLYRQHGNNLIGGGTSWTKRWKRFKQMYRGGFKESCFKHIKALRILEDQMPLEQRAELDMFEQLLKEHNFFRRLWLLSKLRLYRQTLIGTISLYMLVFFAS